MRGELGERAEIREGPVRGRREPQAMGEIGGGEAGMVRPEGEPRADAGLRTARVPLDDCAGDLAREQVG